MIVELTVENLDQYERDLAYLARSHHILDGRDWENNPRIDGKRAWAEWNIRKPIILQALATGMYGCLLDVEMVCHEEGAIPYSQVVGFLDYWIINCFVEGCNICYLQNMRLLPGWRKQGYGSMLVIKLREICKARNVEEIHVASGPDGVPFYEAIGFNKKETDILYEINPNDLKLKERKK